MLIFLFVGLGLAAPYVLLSWNPAWLKFLPKPGAWMEKFKIAMGFPMLATAVWLFNLASGDYGTNVLWLGVFLVVVAFAAWIFGEFVQRGRTGKGVAARHRLDSADRRLRFRPRKPVALARTPIVDTDSSPTPESAGRH